MLDLWELIDSLGIKASKPTVIFNQPRLGKDGITTYPVVIRVLTEKQNIIKFLNNVKYRYNAKGNKAVKKSLAALTQNDMFRN